MPEFHGTCSWPGIYSIVGASYSCSHGITPGTIVVHANHQSHAPGAFGDFVISDGIHKPVVIPDCRLNNIHEEIGPNGRDLSFEIQDRRWKWNFGAIFGQYNQLDPHGKLIPWSVRSPTELALLCLQAMGETNFFVDMPQGLASTDTASLTTFLKPGQVLPPTGVNPPVCWDGEPPASALDRLANQFGRRVVYNPLLNRVYVVQPGDGMTLPGDGVILSATPSLSAPPRPDGVAVFGVPTRFQARFLLEAVGEEWDGSLVPINQLSYAPAIPGEKRIVKATATGVAAGQEWKVTVTIDGKGYEFSYTSAGGDTGTTVATALLALINANVKVAAVLTATSSTNVLTLTGKKDGPTFDMETFVSGTDAVDRAFTKEVVQAGAKGGFGWKFFAPPTFGGSAGALNADDTKNFAGVRATDRLTQDKALELAQKTVWKWYRLVNSAVDPHDTGAILVPGFGRVVRQQQVILEDTQVDQVTPSPALGLDPLLHPLIANFYNGYSRDKPAACYGSVCKDFLGSQYIFRTGDGTNPNTPVGSQIFVDFSIDRDYQVVRFSAPVVSWESGQWKEPDPLILQTACTVRDPITNDPVRFVVGGPLNTMQMGTNYAAVYKPDVQLNISSEYADDGTGNETILVSTSILEVDPINRAAYYVAGEALKFQVAGAETRKWAGIRTIGLDGAIQQVTWSVGAGGSETVASRNCEHSFYVPPYPARRRAEMLRPAMQNRILDAASPPRRDVTGENPQ